MSRVEDDRQAQRLQERVVQEKRLAEAKGKKQQEGESAFSKLVQQQASPQQKTPEQKMNLGQAVLARATQQGQGGQRAEGKSFQERVLQQPGNAAEPSAPQQQEQASVSRREDHRTTETRTEARGTESREEGETRNERNAESSLGRAVGGKGALKTDTESGGKGGGGGKEKDGKGEAAAAAGFRFNPALMAPVPVAQPKPAAGSERLRAIANEIAQKIVERVRVGTNAAGNAEFQIDLRGDVLSGLSIKISARNGKISATFSGSDRGVLKMLQEQSDGLRSALGTRGLKLEDLRFEAKA
ncbi:flagellar hook-length control protein FliK [Myxococcaceae bacterium GXIMD 01537]